MVGFLSFVVCLLLSAGLGYGAYRRAQRRDRRGATRWTAMALLPVGLDLAGFVRLGRKVADAVGHWGVRLVFDPLVWIGILMLGLAALLWVVSGFGQDSVSEPAPVASGRRAKAVGPSRQQASADPMDAEVEAILRRRGVS